MLYNMKPILIEEKEIDDFSFQIEEDEISNISNFFSDVKFILPIEVKVTIQNKAGLMTLKIESCVNYETHCARCTEPVLAKLALDITKVISDEEYDEENTEYVYMDEYKQIDISKVVLEQVVFDMPFRVFCKEDCKGLCPNCGANLNITQCDCNKKNIDPRLAILKTLLDE